MSTATFGFFAPATGPGSVFIMQPNQVFTEVVSKQLPAGSYEFFAFAGMEALSTFDSAGDARCELRQGNFFVGGTTSRIELSGNANQKRVLTVFGGAVIPTGGGEIGLWCMSQFSATERGLQEEVVSDGLIMAVTLGGFN